MGRVRKYKKYKACDPFSKQKAAVDDSKYDQPPDVWENKVKSSKKRKSHDWDNEEERERMLQQEAMRDIRREEKQAVIKKKQIAAKMPGEKLSDFKKRLRQETTKTLNEEISKMSSTARRRKEKLKERSRVKVEKKRSAGKKGDAEDVQDFHMSEKGKIRPSDLGCPASFEEFDKQRFGEQPDRPPELTTFTAKFRKAPMVADGSDYNSSSVEKEEAEDKAESQDGIKDGVDENHDDQEKKEEEQEEEEKYRLLQEKRRRKKMKVADRWDTMNGDDGLECAGMELAYEKAAFEQHIKSTVATVKAAGGPASQKSEVDLARLQAQVAYKQLRSKRHAAHQSLYS